MKRVSLMNIWSKTYSREWNSRCKGPEVGAMPGMFEEQQDDHCYPSGEAEGKPEGVMVK